MRVLFVVLLAVAGALAGELEEITSVSFLDRKGEWIDGGVAEDGVAYTWGRLLLKWEYTDLRSKTVEGGPFGEGGCLADMDGDGRNDLVLQTGTPKGRLVWFDTQKWERNLLDRGVEMHDCTGATLFGRRGVLVVHRGMQVRFYEASGEIRDIYSFYTPSRQGGLLLADVNGDGRTDILCGNYWIESPAVFEESWRLHAINTISETPDSATFRLGLLEPADGLVAVQGHMSEAGLWVFRRPANPREQWTPTRLFGDLAYAHGFALDRGRKSMFVAENNGRASRLMRITPDGQRAVLERGVPMHTLLLLGDQLMGIGKHTVMLWRHHSE